MKTKTVFFCTDCGNDTPKWQGRCPACGSWNTLVEQSVETKTSAAAPSARPRSETAAKPLGALDMNEELRVTTGMSELDRVLGGGAVTGSLVLVGGAPGIGKSTLLLQICGELGSSGRVLYVSGEESERQIKMRAERLGVTSGDIFLLTETNIEEILVSAGELKPTVMIVDSIQTLHNAELSSPPGSVTQVKDCASTLMRLAKLSGVTVFLIGHVNKEGAIAGPRVLEHMVDCVLYFEGEPQAGHRILRAAKNRFGSTNEIGVFEMAETGLREIENPSEQLLTGRPRNTPGTCVTCVMEGTRPILAELQALITPSAFNVPRRNATGLDFNRAMMLLAVLEKRGGLRVGACDAYLNVVGGLYIDEPGADLATVLAIASCYRDKPVGDDVVAIGEVGLTGELRGVSQMNLRLQESARLGFKKCVIPYTEKNKPVIPAGLQVVQAKTLSDALKELEK
ncbi:MAG: DNA repair protein RadA [Oscillospiraceae bacterium]|jgi:DNA repair protein RadA/Sms|nr:DNA repair protein RadA [Oscillospiraceae bacterium]